MSLQDETRVNNFDRWVGIKQTQHVIKWAAGYTILDVGCGTGEFTPLYRERFYKVVGLDPSEKYLQEAKKVNSGVTYFQGFGEFFTSEEKFGTIALTMLLEHVDDPVTLLKNCKKLLSKGGRIIAQVPNANSVTRRLGVLMGIIPTLTNITAKERDYYGHKRIYTLNSLEQDCAMADFKTIAKGGLLFKPLPNEMLEKICREKEIEWTTRFIDALIKFGEDRPEDCANLWIVCE